MMANYIQLSIDKDTGEYAATNRTGPGGTSGHQHKQITPSALWVINHGYGSALLICQIFTPSGEQLLPDAMKIVDINTVHVTFGAVQDGLANIMFFEAI